MTTLTITIPDEVAAQLAAAARTIGKTTEDLVREYLAERVEDEADLAAALAAEAEGGEPIPIEEVKRRLGMV